MEELEKLFEGLPIKQPKFRHIFGDNSVKDKSKDVLTIKTPARVPEWCCVTGTRIRRGDNFTKWDIPDTSHFVLAKRPLSQERYQKLVAIAKKGAPKPESSSKGVVTNA